MSRKINKNLIHGGLVFVFAGILGLALPFISFSLSDDYTILQKLAEEKSAQSYNNQFISSGLPAGQEGQGGETAPLPTYRPDPNLTNIPDRLVIPKIKIDMPIFESDSANVLLKGGWMFPGTSSPDKVGNTVIFGHRFRFLPPITNTFYSLDKVGVGDTFTVAWKGRIYNYKVKTKKIIEPTDFSVLNQSQEAEITLITCAPLFSTKQRLVVVGSLIRD